MSSKRILVLYGSQTGNAESIAKEFQDILEREGLNSKCLSLNSVSANEMKENADLIAIVCSTTGNGDAPENADSFWRAIKKRTLPKDLLAGLQFAVLGLGDTNYDKFCFMGKAIDKRFFELGASRFLEIHCADESTNLEEIVESWKSLCLKKIQQIESESRALESALKVIDDIDCNSNNIAESETSPSSRVEENCSPDVQADHVTPNGVLTISEIVKHFQFSIDLSSSPDSSLLPRSRKNNDSNFEVVLEAKSQKPSGTGVNCNSSPVEWTVENPFPATVNSARWLTKPPDLTGPLCSKRVSEEVWETTRDVILVDINIRLSGIQYQPGDSIAICVPNPEKLVNCVIERLQSSDPSLQKDTIIRKSDGEELSLFELFSYRLDLVSIPKKPTILALADCCQDEIEANSLRFACCKGETGKLLWKYMFEDQHLGIGELLALYTSCSPSLQTLISILSALPPRAYSIASSPLLYPSSVSIAMSLVRFCCVSGGYQSKEINDELSKHELRVIKRSGLCTSYLHHLLKKLLYPHTQHPDETLSSPIIRIIHKPSATFRLPGSVAPPLVLIGPGTGVAPFIGFLSHRSALERERKLSGEDICTGMWRGGCELEGKCDLPCEGNAIDEFLQMVPSGSIHLYFGCRCENDWIFRENMEMRLEEGILTVLETALSRTGPERTYVTHRLKSRGSELSDLILNQNAYVYICGDGCRMAKDVTRTLIDILAAHGSMTTSEAEKVLDTMKQRRRFVLDIWS